jgi:serralysin
MPALTITTTDTDGLSIANPSIANPITVAAGVTLRNATGIALELLGGAYKVQVNGTVLTTSLDANALELYAPGLSSVSKVTVAAGGKILGAAESEFSYGLVTFHATDVNNAGQIYGANAIEISGGAKAYKITNSGLIQSYSYFVGDQEFSRLALNLTGSAKHTINNSGSILGSIEIHNGTNSITNTGTISHSLNGDGTSLLAISLFDSKDTITNKGTINGGIFLGSGADKLTNSGTITGDISLGVDNDSFTNKGIINGDVNLGSENDKASNKGIITGEINLGAGDDKFTGGNQGEVVKDGAGKDSIKTGAGDDEIFLAADAQNDTIDGGAGLHDRVLYYLSAESRVVINLDKVNHTDILTGALAAKNTAAGADIGIDKIKNIEDADVGSGNDLIFGNSADNRLRGYVGDDTIYGGAGNDDIGGYNGADILCGEAGADVLDGGFDGDIDTYLYKAVSDSTVAETGRDYINGFGDGTEYGEDVIDFRLLNLVNGNFIGDLAFTAGDGDAEVRAVNFGTKGAFSIFVDSNDDGIADMQIDGDGGHTFVGDGSVIVFFTVNWDASDFRFV